MNKYLVKFGFKVKAKTMEEARKKAKKNLKTHNKRQAVDCYEIDKIFGEEDEIKN